MQRSRRRVGPIFVGVVFAGFWLCACNDEPYPLLSPHAKGDDGQLFARFHYRELGGDAIEIDPEWKDDHTVVIWFPDPSGDKTRTEYGHTFTTRSLRVNEEALLNFQAARDTVARNAELRALIRKTRVFQPRYKRGKKELSNHCWGLAIDVNAQQFPMGMKDDNPSSSVALLRKFVFTEANGFRWGNDFSDPDPMHFEVHIDAGDAITRDSDGFGDDGASDE